MENYVVSLEIAKKMAKVGWGKKTEFYYWGLTDGGGSPCYPYIKKEGFKLITKEQKETRGCHPFEECYSAPLSDEILKELPDNISLTRVLNGSKEYEAKSRVVTIWETSASNALGLMWLYLAENNQLTKR